MLLIPAFYDEGFVGQVGPGNIPRDRTKIGNLHEKI